MRLVDCFVKVLGPEVWLYHTASSYKVRMDESALRALESLMARTSAVGLAADEALIHERLSRRGLLVEGDSPGSLRVFRKSRLRTLDLELCSRCNLECGHCYASLDRKSVMQRPTLERIFESVGELEPVNLVLGGGEPLQSPQWRHAVTEGRRRGLRVVLMTNGTLVTADVAAFLGELRVAKVAVSLDGFEAQHDALRGPRAFERTVAGIRRLVARGIQVFVSTMVSGDLAARKDEFERFCVEDLGVTSVQLSAVVPVGKGKSAPAQFQMPDAALREMFRTSGLQDDLEPGGTEGKAWPCEAGVEQVFISSGGSVYACHYFHNLQESMGDLGSASLAEIYRSGLEGPVAARTPWRELAGCKDCPALGACKTGCRARAKLLAGTFDAPDPHACRIHR